MKTMLPALVLLLAACANAAGRSTQFTTQPTTLPVIQSDWSQTKGGVRCRLAIGKAVFASQEAIAFTIEIQNMSESAVAFRIRRDGGCIAIQAEGGKEMPYCGPAYAHASLPVGFKPQESYSFTEKIEPVNYLLTAGEYRAYFFEEEPADDKSTIVLKTPAVSFKLVAGERPATQATQPAATPEAAWDALARAMQAGDKEAIRRATTARGYQHVVMKNQGGEEWPTETLRQVGQGWASLKPQFVNRSDQAADAVVGEESKLQSLHFVRTTEGWKLDEWLKGL